MQYARYLAFFAVVVFCLSCDQQSDSSPETTGQGGSTTRYSIQGNYLYVVDDTSLKVYNIAGNSFVQVNDQEVGFGIETVFSRPDYLYLGAVDGMYIYSLANPEDPDFVFRYAHIIACDPVVVQGNRAYVTLSAHSEICNRGIDALEIIDITDRYNPVRVRSYPMQSPRGLAVEDNYLFVCEGPFGLKVYDIEDEQDIKLKQHLTGYHAFDVIARSGRLTVTGEDGIMQYSYPPVEGQQSFLKLLSKIPVNRQ